MSHKKISSSEAMLRREVTSLRRENERLRNQVEFLSVHPTIARGMRGELLVSRLVNGKHSLRGAGHDLQTIYAGTYIEVKYSGLLGIRPGEMIRRWVWSKLFGEAGKKKYDRLLLVGDVDLRFLDAYLDPGSPYIIFDVPFRHAVDMASGIIPGRPSRIEITTNPATVKTWQAKKLYGQYQISAIELESRYPSLRPAENDP